MKKVLKGLAVAAAMLATGIGFSQESGVGVKGGLNLVMVKPDGADEGGNALGFNIGGYYKYMATDAFAVQGELVYSRESFDIEFVTPIGTIETSTAINFVDINVVPKYYVTEGLSLEGVLGFGIAASSSVEVNGEEAEDAEDAESAVLFGLGAAYELDSPLGFNLRWINRSYSDYSWNTIQLGATYNF